MRGQVMYLKFFPTIYRFLWTYLVQKFVEFSEKLGGLLKQKNRDDHNDLKSQFLHEGGMVALIS